jgi:hypothetical protein
MPADSLGIAATHRHPGPHLVDGIMELANATDLASVLPAVSERRAARSFALLDAGQAKIDRLDLFREVFVGLAMPAQQTAYSVIRRAPGRPLGIGCATEMAASLKSMARRLQSSSPVRSR